ncbi:MAG: tRNA 4-thiouridine(8) synthase ThiI [Clostridia bacterium]|nr:tRNA 4-thiouridine(8) synthase ThiI [Clostridia bacterium]
MYDHILIRYGELALKGRNQMDFVRRLVKNIKQMVYQYYQESPVLEMEKGRIFLKLNGQEPQKYYEPLANVFGILSFSPVRKAELDMDQIKKAALEEFRSLPGGPKTFRTTVRRPNKRFPVKSPQAQREIGAYILKNVPNLKVDLHNPEVEVFVELRDDGAYIYTQKIYGHGGLPLGTGGKALLLLSGGIDSPVAGWLTMKRGIEIEALHFYSYPYTSERAKEKVVDLAKVLAKYCGQINVHIVPFTKIQEAISANCYESLWITIMRRFMFRIAERIARRREALALVTGESIGQVASQTLDSMYAINEVTNMPVIRPLITSDKEEIMELARKIDTYDISIRPYADCCTVFLPREPKTKPKLVLCHKEETKLKVEELVEEAVNNTETILIKADEKDEFGYF